MAHYEEGSAPDVNNMLGKLRTAMAANGWTVHYNDNEGGSGGVRCHMSKGGLVVNLRTGFNNEVPVALAAERSARQGTWNWNYTYGNPLQTWRPNWIAMNCGTGVNMSRSWHNQPGAPGSTELKGLASMITAPGAISRYWMFILDDPTAVFLIMETSANKFQWLAFGDLEMCQKVQAGGQFFFGSRSFNKSYGEPQEALFGIIPIPNASYVSDDCATCFVRLVDTRWTASGQLDGWNHTMMTPGAVNSYGNGNFWGNLGLPVPDSTYNNPAVSGFLNLTNVSYLEQEGRTVLWPIGAYKAMGEGAGYELIGFIPHVGRLSLKAYAAGDQVAGVGDTYQAFPSHHRISPFNIYNYGTLANNPADESFNYYGTGVAVRRQ